MQRTMPFSYVWTAGSSLLSRFGAGSEEPLDFFLGAMVGVGWQEL